METRLPCRPTRGSLTSPSYLVRNRTLGPPLENNPEPPPSSRLEGLRLLYGLETSLSTSLQTPQEAQEYWSGVPLPSPPHTHTLFQKQTNSGSHSPPRGYQAQCSPPPPFATCLVSTLTHYGVFTYDATSKFLTLLGDWMPLSARGP